ncbi:MAG: phosphotransferase [Pseudomonadota bacterium]
MSDRAEEITAFLARTHWADWQQQPMTGDASARRYLRLVNGEDSVILMDAPPGTAGPTEPFVRIAGWLAKQGLAPPVIHAHDPALGLMLLSDLGPVHFAQELQAGNAQLERERYLAATDVLIHLSRQVPPDGLTRMTPEIGADMVMMLAHYAPNTDLTVLNDAVRTAMQTYAPNPDRVALRDFHAENLIWQPQAKGLTRVGLLDFQDAFIAPDGYDLASLLRDARRDVSKTTRQAVLARYAEATGADATFQTRLAVLGVQRNLRILGIFARLAAQDGKRRYLAFLPRVWRHILDDLSDPALRPLKDAVLATLPAPEAHG